MIITLLKKIRRRALNLLWPPPPPPPPPQPPADPNPPPNFNPDWAQIIGPDLALWKTAVQNAQKGSSVLIATSVGGYAPGVILEGLLAMALTLRGVRVQILLCDELLPICMQALVYDMSESEFVQYGIKRLCRYCFSPAQEAFKALGLTILRYSQFVTAAERESARTIAMATPYAAIGKFDLDGIHVGEHALAGALRYYARGTLEESPEVELVVRRHLEASLLTTYMARRLFETQKFQGVCFHHGIYVPQGLIGEVARQKNVNVVNWNPAYRKHCFIFSHGDTYHHTLMNEPTRQWDSMRWTGEQDAEIIAYLKSRWQGTRDWIWFHEKPEEDLAAISAELGIDFSRPCIGLLTNVMWDAQLHYPANAFPNMLDWVEQSIRYFAQRPDLQLVIRIHPAEVRGTLVSRQPLLAEIQRLFPDLPKNVFIIPPESQISTYAVMAQCNAALIYGTKTGVELTSLGIPVIVAGEAWIRNKGLSLDAHSPQEYNELLARLPFPARMDEAATQRARQYAYHFFFRRMIPLEMMEPTSAWPPYKIAISSLADLQPGRSRGLDVVCDGILNSSDFIYPAEIVGLTA